MKSKAAPSGIMLYAKSSGLTSFSSLWSIKHALGTEKVGHTGTLDSFADGLLVVLSGHLTHLVPHVTGFTKSYEAIVCFGKETDTLDPTGEVINVLAPVTKEQIEGILPKFTGAILQTPPAFSALHVDGKRASDLVREGKEVNLESRQIFIYGLELYDYFDNKTVDGCTYAKLKITCSKGTYIRALARDIALELGSCAHLCALRRTQVGPFRLEDAACYKSLGEFTIAAGMESEKKIRLEKENKSLLEKAEEKIFSRRKEKKPREKDSDEKIADIKSRFLDFTPELAALCGFNCDILKNEAEKNYSNGRPLSPRMFDFMENLPVNKEFYVQNEIAVFYKDGAFAGIMKKNGDRLNYGFVVPHAKKNMQVFSWKELCDGAFPVQWKKKGSAITVGSFEAVHKGHQELVNYVLAEKERVSGIVTFASSISRDDRRNIFTLRQRLEFFESIGIDFAVVIDFDEDFAKLSGESFFEILSEKCSLKFLAEGNDFKCGYKGSFAMDQISVLSDKMGFVLKQAEYVEYQGLKVSSSRIKKDIAAGNFAEVKEMLGRPFEFSLKGHKFVKKADGANLSTFETLASDDQVLPEKGTYKVVVSFADGSTLHTDINIGENRISLLLPTQKYADNALGVIF
ncbi:tRNA pseudouridine(55) synthase TruB [Treponema sp.]|uniref:tRNA pseudouridine(55) synthase TruB n=1 Tax=Treponema sp. TaxID=166 RepID=UPI00298E9531|nr:tRNA pseudouridine(55) synthase TruB [Treponema sp.]MCQ2241076.1 tRNA pseudouridine(55) synthase TruB [Treponema sp.]